MTRGASFMDAGIERVDLEDYLGVAATESCLASPARPACGAVAIWRADQPQADAHPW
jgi:hypothetical protein